MDCAFPCVPDAVVPWIGNMCVFATVAGKNCRGRRYPPQRSARPHGPNKKAGTWFHVSARYAVFRGYRGPHKPSFGGLRRCGAAVVDGHQVAPMFISVLIGGGTERRSQCTGGICVLPFIENIARFVILPCPGRSSF